MRILVVSNGYPPRGSFGTEFYTRELVRALAGRGHALAVLHPERSGRRPRYEVERVEEDGVPVFLLHNPGDPSRRFAPSYLDEGVEAAFDALLARERPDVVHFVYLLWGLSLRLPAVARARGIPSVATLTDYGLLCHRGQMFDARLERCGGPHPAAVCARCIRTPLASDHAPPARLARTGVAELLASVGGLGVVPVRADLERREREVRLAVDALARLIAPTHAFLEVYARAGVPRRKLEPLVYAFDARAYRPRAPSGAARRVRLGFLGQFGPHKGLACLFQAARILAGLAGEADWELVLYGGEPGGRHRRYARAWMAAADGRRVRLARPFGPDEAPEVLAELDALVAPSEWDENAPLAILQARAMGLPVIATDVPGISEIVRVPQAGRLVPVGDAPALARAMLEVVRGALRAPLEPGLPLSLERHVQRLETLYAEVRVGSPGEVTHE